jgi:hypothetical protein
VLRLVAWALGLFALASVFVPLKPGLTRGLDWALCLYSTALAVIAIGRARRGAFLAYAAVAVLANPIVPFHFAPEVWRVVYAGAALWLLGDHLPGPDV